VKVVRHESQNVREVSAGVFVAALIVRSQQPFGETGQSVILSRRRVLFNPFECGNGYTCLWLRRLGGTERKNARYLPQHFILSTLDLLVKFPIRFSQTAVFFVEIQRSRMTSRLAETQSEMASAGVDQTLSASVRMGLYRVGMVPLTRASVCGSLS